LPAGPGARCGPVAERHPVKKSALAYIDAYENCSRPKASVSTFGAHAWDTGVLLQAAIPVALKTAQPAPRSSRSRCAMHSKECENTAGAHGIFNMSPNDHLGLDQRAAVMVMIPERGVGAAAVGVAV